MKKRLNYIPAMGISMACLLLSAGSAQAAPCGAGRDLPNNTWYMYAPPCTPDPLGVDVQVGDDITGGIYDTNWISFRWDADNQAYIEQQTTTELELALGYGNWHYSIAGNNSTLIIDGTETPVVDCTQYGMAQDCYPIDLVIPADGSTAWNMIGNPFTYTVDWADVRIAANISTPWTTYTPTAAEVAGYVLKNAQRYTIAQSYTPFDDVAPDPGTLEIQESVWVRSMDPVGHSATALKLLIPTALPAVPTVEGQDGTIWMDRNLGAIQVATSSTDADAYGDLYQWGCNTKS